MTTTNRPHNATVAKPERKRKIRGVLHTSSHHDDWNTPNEPNVMHSSSKQRVTLPPVFHRLAWSNLLAQSAEQISLAAAPLVAVFLLGASAAQTGLLQTAQTLPFLLLSLPMGVYADRHSRRALMASAEAVRVPAMITILVLPGAALATQTGAGACLLMSSVAFAIQLVVIVQSPVTQLAALPEGAAS
jgi:MFS family permease